MIENGRFKIDFRLTVSVLISFVVFSVATGCSMGKTASEKAEIVKAVENIPDIKEKTQPATITPATTAAATTSETKAAITTPVTTASTTTTAVTTTPATTTPSTTAAATAAKPESELDPNLYNPDGTVIGITSTKEVKRGNQVYTADTTPYVIKGNKKSRIYHSPGQADYNKISVNNVVHFATKEDAEAAGYKPSAK